MREFSYGRHPLRLHRVARPKIGVLLGTWVASIGALVNSVAFGQWSYGTEMYQARLHTAWVAHVPSTQSWGEFPEVTLFVSPTRMRTYYELVEGIHRTVFSGPNAQRNADIRQRVHAMSGKEANVEIREVPLITLLAQSRTGSLEAIDGETGERKWSVAIGTPGGAEFAAAMNDDYVVTVSGTRMYVISADTGKLVWERRLDHAPGFGPVLAGSRVFVPKVQGVFAVFWLEDDSRRLPPKTMTSFGRTSAQPVMTPMGLMWSTNRHTVFLADATNATARLKLKGRAPVVGAPSFRRATSNREESQVFVAFEDGYLISLDTQSGQTIWEFLAEDNFAEGPFTAGDVVLVPTLSHRVYAIDANSGRELWTATGVARIGAFGDDAIYAESASNNLLVLDARTGETRSSVRLEPNERLVANTATDRVYLITRQGRIRCLRPANALWPTIHVGLPETPAATIDASTERDGEAESSPPAMIDQPAPAVDVPATPKLEPDETPLEDDPFGLGNDDDPFGG